MVTPLLGMKDLMGHATVQPEVQRDFRHVSGSVSLGVKASGSAEARVVEICSTNFPRGSVEVSSEGATSTSNP